MTSIQGAPYIVVHGGVVKTASSYLQAILKRNSGRLLKQEVIYSHHRKTRKHFTVPCQLNALEKMGIDFEPKVSDQELAGIAYDFFDVLKAKSGQRIILSDENLAGHSGHCARVGRLFNKRRMFTKVFSDNVIYDVKEVHFAVRNYADFYASTYIEYLRSATARRVVSENTMKQLVYTNLESWGKLAADISRAFTEAQITVWRHEDFSALNPVILQNLCGPSVDIDSFAPPKRKRGRPSASHKAVQTLLVAIDRFGADEAIDKWAEIQETYPRGPEFPPYDPWTESERAHLSRLYEKDVQELEKIPRVRVLRP